MRKSYVMGMIGAAAIILSGCGGGDSTTTTAVATGTGTYVDSAVAGVSYTCGGQSGVTDENGSFTFEVGSDCEFKMGDIVLRTVDGSMLVDGAKVLEDNVTVAAFLQTLDADGDPSNGITVLPAVANLIQEQNLTGVPSGAELSTLVTEIESSIDDYNGTVVTEEEATTHLEESLGGEMTDMLGGKTFYMPHMEDGIKYFTKIVVNADVTQIAWSDLNSAGGVDDNGTDTVHLSGTMIVFENDDHNETYVGKTADYIILESNDGSQVHLYADEAKAKTAYSALTYDAKALVDSAITQQIYLYNVGKDTDGAWMEGAKFTKNSTGYTLSFYTLAPTASGIQYTLSETLTVTSFSGATINLTSSTNEKLSGTITNGNSSYIEILTESGSKERFYYYEGDAYEYYLSLGGTPVM